MTRSAKALVIGAGAWLGMRAWAALRPSAFPYFARAILEVPRPFLTRGRLLEILGPTPGERMLEIGPGTGYYSLAVASEVRPGGTLDVLDVRQRFLDHTIDRARRAAVDNIVPTLGDGGPLPFADGTFDAVFLVTTLGEIPDPPAALRELRRVLKPDGRLVIGEILIDPDFPRLRWVMRRTESAGFELERQTGMPIAYFARFRPRLESAGLNSEGDSGASRDRGGVAATEPHPNDDALPHLRLGRYVRYRRSAISGRPVNADLSWRSARRSGVDPRRRRSPPAPRARRSTPSWPSRPRGRPVTAHPLPSGR